MTVLDPDLDFQTSLATGDHELSGMVLVKAGNR